MKQLKPRILHWHLIKPKQKTMEKRSTALKTLDIQRVHTAHSHIHWQIHKYLMNKIMLNHLYINWNDSEMSEKGNEWKMNDGYVLFISFFFCAYQLLLIMLIIELEMFVSHHMIVVILVGLYHSFDSQFLSMFHYYKMI